MSKIHVNDSERESSERGTVDESAGGARNESKERAISRSSIVLAPAAGSCMRIQDARRWRPHLRLLRGPRQSRVAH
eukprot:gene10092-biopygen6168